MIVKTVMVTGGAGFIGSNFVRYLFEKYSDYKILLLDLLTYAGDIENIPEIVRNSYVAAYFFKGRNTRNRGKACPLRPCCW